MTRSRSLRRLAVLAVGLALFVTVAPRAIQIAHGAGVTHLRDGAEFTLSPAMLVAAGQQLFQANWPAEEGGGRPLTKGTGRPLSDTSLRIAGAHASNRVSGPDANSCASCHNLPYGIVGGGGDFVTGVFVLGQRFDFLTFDRNDALPLRGALDERGRGVTLQDAADYRATTGMFGAGYLEMLARQITEELQRTRISMRLGETRALSAKGISFGTLTLRQDGIWDTSKVSGLGRLSLISGGTTNPPTLIVRPWHQASNVVSLREFTNTAFNQHHGIQSTERFGVDTDPDGDGVRNEMTRADVSAVSVFQATLPVPGRVIPRDPVIEHAVLNGEAQFERIGCAACHIPRLPLDNRGWVFVEPNPFNPAGNLRTGEAPPLKVDLSDETLPKPRLAEESGIVWVDAYTDFKLHDLCGTEGPREPLDQNQSQWSPRIRDGNCRFLTKRLWGAANEPPFFHHGLFTTLRQSVLAHDGEAQSSRDSFKALPPADQDALIEFLKTLQVLPRGVKDRIVDEKFRARAWPPAANAQTQTTVVGREPAIPRHLRDGEEWRLPIADLIDFGRQLFAASWTDQDGAGRPLSKGNGRPLNDASLPLRGVRGFNRVSGPDANACRGCHAGPNQAAGGGGEVVANAFVMANRFDFVTFDRGDTTPTRGAVDEGGQPVTLQSVGNARLTPGLWGAGYVEMLARQMTGDLRRVRDSIQPGQSRPLVSKGVSFGSLSRRRDGSWVTDRIEGLPRPSVAIDGPHAKPSLALNPWRQSGSVASLREITVSSFNEHHGLQATERFGVGTDPDGDGVINELTRADITAVTAWQATLPVPGQVIPNDPRLERTIEAGERVFDSLRCSTCHVPALPLTRTGWVYSEGQVKIDLSSDALPQPRLRASDDEPATLFVSAYTDLKLHDITDPADQNAAESLDINEPAGSPAFARGNRRFLTRRLWGVGNQASYFHDGRFTSLKDAVLAHSGEALESRRAFEQATPADREAVLEFLRSLQVLPAGTKSILVDERFQPKVRTDRASTVSTDRR